MAYRKCAACGKWYDTSAGGCTNASCTLADRSRVSRITDGVRSCAHAVSTLFSVGNFRIAKLTNSSPLEKQGPVLGHGIYA